MDAERDRDLSLRLPLCSLCRCQRVRQRARIGERQFRVAGGRLVETRVAEQGVPLAGLGQAGADYDQGHDRQQAPAAPHRRTPGAGGDGGTVPTCWITCKVPDSPNYPRCGWMRLVSGAPSVPDASWVPRNGRCSRSSDLCHQNTSDAPYLARYGATTWDVSRNYSAQLTYGDVSAKVACGSSTGPSCGIWSSGTANELLTLHGSPIPRRHPPGTSRFRSTASAGRHRSRNRRFPLRARPPLRSARAT